MAVRLRMVTQPGTSPRRPSSTFRNIGGSAVDTTKHEMGTCSASEYACKLLTRDEDGGVETEGPQFESVSAFGSTHGVSDLDEVIEATELCDDYGIDTVSAGVTVVASLVSEDEFGNADLAQQHYVRERRMSHVCRAQHRTGRAQR